MLSLSGVGVLGARDGDFWRSPGLGQQLPCRPCPPLPVRVTVDLGLSGRKGAPCSGVGLLAQF